MAGNGSNVEPAALEGCTFDKKHLSGEATLKQDELIDRARRGDGDAWVELVRLHQEGVFRFAYLKLGDVDEAKDIAQETFIRAFRSLDSFDPQRPLRPWLLTIAANLARNRWRSLGRYWGAMQRWMAQEARLGSLQRGADADAYDPVNWQAQALWRAVRELPSQDQDVIYLRFFMELPVGEAALALDVAPGTVKSRSHRALTRLRGVIRRSYPDLEEAFEA